VIYPGPPVKSARKIFLLTPLKSDFGQNISSNVEAKRLGKHNENAVHFHVAQGGCGMRTYDFSPLFRSTVGFDRLFDMLDNGARPDWPPYNIERVGEDQYRISMALAGFGSDEIELIQQGNILTVTGRKKAEEARNEGMLHQGMAFRNFKHSFNLADHVKVASAKLENGLLSVELVREIPEQLKPRRIELASTTASQDNQPRLTDDQPEPQRKVA
jgi:molecular chaperone IbpA